MRSRRAQTPPLDAAQMYLLKLRHDSLVTGCIGLGILGGAMATAVITDYTVPTLVWTLIDGTLGGIIGLCVGFFLGASYDLRHYPGDPKSHPIFLPDPPPRPRR